MERVKGTVRKMRSSPVYILMLVLIGCNNPFAPTLDTSPSGSQTILGDQTQIDGVFQNFKQAYAFRDSTIYGQLLATNFIFVYRDYENSKEVFWGRDEDIRSTFDLFQNVQRLDLIWNSINSSLAEPDSLKVTISRYFNLTVTFSPSDIVRVDGKVNLILERPKIGETWKITRWHDESNY